MYYIGIVLHGKKKIIGKHEKRGKEGERRLSPDKETMECYLWCHKGAAGYLELQLTAVGRGEIMISSETD